MERLNLIYFSSILNRPIKDETDDTVGILKDIYINRGQGYPKAIGYKVDKSGDIYNYEFKDIEFYEDSHGRVSIEVRGARDIIPQSFSFLISKDILDKEVVDVNGKRSFKVHDVRMVQLDDGLRLLAIDKSRNGWARRNGLSTLMKGWNKVSGQSTSESLILWDDVESLKESKNLKDTLKLSVPYQELSTLHPADLADVLEEVESHYRNLVFETLDEELAADTLEEIEAPGVQAEILSAMSETKAQEILEMIPNDEIAEILEEMDDEAKAKILSNLVYDDATEVQEILSYSDEEAGSIMAKEFLSFLDSLTVREAREIIRELSDEYDSDEMYYIFVTDQMGELMGFISMSDLIQNADDALLRDIMNTRVEDVNARDHAETAVDLAIKYELLQIPVVDDDNKLVGVINIHDVIDEFLAPLWKRKN
ncbi:CBS domain-containing protein [Proteiniclasticum sp. QWL-01]|uniref:magnesium transporter MgtE N-terminal domain-containing protein n=1 Tax=Proteiniclasticum sp. QWL-01 TaxID=3036945 RepID=UPI002410BC4C|nr:CBS domain-containing protein [Proteiniclasticum sp. QWL-01]WFF73906.1 CBS domain-containing protein [Proteiniclasticum sp. QWL-01]